MPRQTHAKKQVDRIVGKNIRDLRVQKQMEPSDLARELRVSADQINKIERGDRGLNIAQLIHLSALFDVPLERLAYQDGIRPRIIPFLKVAL